MLMRLYWDQRSKARNTSFSATVGLLGSMLVFMWSQRLRMICSRDTNWEFWPTDFLNSAILSVRSFQLCVSGESTNLSPARMATATMATTARTCWRFLMFIDASGFPAKIEGKLQWSFPFHLIDFQIGDLLHRAQLVVQSQKSGIIA